MPISNSDVVIKYTVKTGSAGNTVAGNAAGSLGKYVSTTELTTATLYNAFPTLTGDQNATSANDYKGFAVHNKHSTLTLLNAVIWLTGKTANSTTYTIGVDPNAASAVGNSAAQGTLIATTAAAPVGVTFSEPLAKSSALALGDIGPGQVKFFWLKRHGNNTAAVAGDNITVAIDGDTRA